MHASLNTDAVPRAPGNGVRKRNHAITLLSIGLVTDGHHERYGSFLSRLLQTEPKGVCKEAVCSPRPVLVPSVENSFPIYAAIAILRALCGRRTAGLLFRPGPALAGTSVRLRVKRGILKLLRRLPQVRTLTILPFSVEPRFAEIADGWIYDLQLWDLDEEERTSARAAQGTLCAAIRRAAAGRLVCCAIGRQDQSKGFDWFSDTYVNSPDIRDGMLFAFGGEVAPELATRLSAFRAAGGFACDRLISDAELLDFYAAADLIWCAYDQNYDQASGILGRAAQLGIPVAVRRGSLIHRLCKAEGMPHIAIDRPTDWRHLAAIPARDPPATAESRSGGMGAESVRRLHEALGAPE